MKTKTTRPRLDAELAALELIRSLQRVIGHLDAELKNQLRRAARSVALNVAEARGRAGKDARYHFRIALGSVRETAMILDVIEAEGTLEAVTLTSSRELLDRLGAMLWRLGR